MCIIYTDIKSEFFSEVQRARKRAVSRGAERGTVMDRGNCGQGRCPWFVGLAMPQFRSGKQNYYWRVRYARLKSIFTARKILGKRSLGHAGVAPSALRCIGPATNLRLRLICVKNMYRSASTTRINNQSLVYSNPPRPAYKCDSNTNGGRRTTKVNQLSHWSHGKK